MEEIRVEKGMEENSPRSKPFCFNYLFTPCWEKPHLFSKGYKSNFKEKKVWTAFLSKTPSITPASTTFLNAVHNPSKYGV